MISGFASNIQKTYPGSSFELLGLTASEALKMAKLSSRDVDGIISTFLPGVFDDKTYLHFFMSQLAQYLGVRARYLDMLDFGGASALAMIYRAFKAIRAGDASTVLCIIGGKASAVRKKGITVDGYESHPPIQTTPFDDFFKQNIDLNPVSDYALVAARHSVRFGTTDEDRARIVTAQRYNAINNPKSLYKDMLSVSDVLKSPLLCSPLHLLEIVYPVDGFHVFIVSEKQSPLVSLKIKGYGEAHWTQMPCELPDIVTTPASESSRHALRDFEIRAVDAFELYDSFTITVLLQMEDIGLLEKGTLKKFLDANDTTYKGSHPINTGGGSLNVGQPAYMSGGVILEEALMQLNGMAPGHQVKGAKNIFLNGIGGWNRGHSVSLLLGVS